MKTLEKQNDNMGGLLTIWAIPADAYSKSGSTITITDDTNVYRLYCSPESLQFIEKPITKKAVGLHYSTDIDSFIPDNVTDIEDAVSFLESRKLVILFQDGNESFRLAGNSFYPLTLLATHSSGKKTSDRAGWNFKFSGKTNSRATIVDNPF